MDMNYSETLKKLFEFTDVKLAILANALGYDISYISKWCNGSKVPSVKSIYNINKKISEIFAKTIVDEDLTLSFYIEFNLTPPSLEDEINYKIIENEISLLLKRSYQKISNNIFDNSEDQIKFLIGSSLIYREFSKSLKKVLLNSLDEDLNIWTSLDIFSYNASYILDILQKSKSTTRRITIHLCYSTIENSPSYEFMIKLYNILCKYPDINIEIYNDINFSYKNFILIKNQFFADFSINEDGFIQTITYGKDEKTINTFYDFISNNFKSNDILLELTSSKSISNSNFRTSFYSGDNFYFFCNYGFEFLLPPDIIIDIAEETYKKTNCQYAMFEIKKLQVTWEELFEKANINFFIFKSTLFDYLENGNILYCNTRYNIPMAKRQEHYEQVIETMKKNPNIKFYIIDDFSWDAMKLQKNFSLYFNETQLFLKNNTEPSKGHMPVLSILRNPEFSKFISLSFENITKNKYCYEFDVSSLEKAYNKYGNMFRNIQKLKEDM